jgi:SnoaL-like domain
MSAIETGKQLVALCQAGRGMEAVETLYDEKIVSIEAQGGDGLPQRMEGIGAVRAKNQWWYDNHEVHRSTATGPFAGHRDDQFAVFFELDATAKMTGQRQQMREIGLYTVAHGKVVQEEFLYGVA